MATITMGEGSTVWINGVDVSSYVHGIGIALDPWQEQLLQRVYALPSLNLRFRGRYDPKPRSHRALFRRNHPRIRRMHAAYGRRHGRGRW